VIARREFITLLGGAAAAWPLAARAQQAGMVRWIGVLMISPDSDLLGRERAAVFEESLAKLGWTVGRNLSIDYRWSVSDLGKARLAVGQIMRLTPNVILANGGPALTATQEATSTVPIVFTGVSEPVERGFVASLAHPGGNTTGFANLEATVAGKWLELFREIAPRARRVTVMFNPASSFAEQFFRAAGAAAPPLAIEVVAARIHDAAEMDPQRRRIRMTNAVLMMVVVPFVVYGFAIATPSKARAYVYVWVITAALLMMIIMVALIDMLNSWRLQRAQLRELRRQIAASRDLDVRAALLGIDKGRAGPGDGRS